MTRTELLATIEAHRKWLVGEEGGTRADLSGAYLSGADLSGADLSGADLFGAYLSGAYLSGADLSGADLSGADLFGADLSGAYLSGADLSGAYLFGADLFGADLSGADLSGADLFGADLSGAYLSGAEGLPGTPRADPPEPYQRVVGAEGLARRIARYRELHPEVPVIEALDSKILEALTTGGGSLDMGQWHTCRTTHCRAGWAITLAGAEGAELERKHGAHRAGAMLYRASTGRVPHFFASTADALEDIRKRAEGEPRG